MKVEFTKKGQPKRKKPFSVQLVDTGSDNGKKSKVASKDDNLEPALMVDIDRQELTIIQQIKLAFPCLEHPKKACYVKTGNGEHYAFTAGDLSIWAGLVRKYKAVIDTPPAVILNGISHRSNCSSPPSSPPKQKRFDYPRVADWMASLDTDEYRGKDNHDYSQFAHIFASEGLSCLDDLHLVGSADKIQTTLQCNLGNANRLWKYNAQITGSGSKKCHSEK
ncbi:hypothetical protein BDP27DRAFT_1373790 [Rhodocollybia butyracea]|uniref:Uncharacterized protein n=1 Tax=Rhodocollybia butyracea TaxID=206335 RepID=A0A9P5P6Q0_9AGAR|nr:hypothetical protein BDP27DRAFT_1373790 [Rhodocollybia butyracea]